MINSVDLKSLRLLWASLAKSHRYSDYVNSSDITYVTRRTETEGLAFLTTALPELGRALDTFHSTTQWKTPDGFQTYPDGLPIFLGWAVKLALEGDSLAVDCVRQLSYLFYKLEVTYDKALISSFLEKFERTDREILDVVSGFGASKSIQNHLAAMGRLVRKVLQNADPTDIRPCHGSGATANQVSNKDKYHTFRYSEKLDACYPYADYFFYSPTHLVDELGKLEDSVYVVPTARVCLVPKDSRGPRVISCEPAEFMYIQQGIMRVLYEVIENHPLTRSQINFSDQSINMLLAKKSSVDDSLATIDLSDASDRLSDYVVNRIFPDEWVKCLQACRSEETELPSGKVIKLNKFAPMGSACCFPVEALTFWSSVQATYERLGVKAKAFVYGDDIIIPAVYFTPVCEDLVSIGLKINATKSYTSGPFRESCGGEYHYGNDVTPVRVRKFTGKSHTLLSTMADLCNEIIHKFGERDAEEAIQLIERHISYVFPRSYLQIPNVVKGSCSGNDRHFRKRWNSTLQRHEYRILQLSTRIKMQREPTWSELVRFELTVESRGKKADKRPIAALLLSLLSDEDRRDEVVNNVRRLEPGEYADYHTARNKWCWVWLG